VLACSAMRARMCAVDISGFEGEVGSMVIMDVEGERL